MEITCKKMKDKSAFTVSARCRDLGVDSFSFCVKKNPPWKANSQENDRNLQNPKVHYRIHNSLTPVPILRASSRACKHRTFSLWGVVSTSTKNTQTGGPPIVSRPLLFIQYIRSYPPYLEAVPPSATCGRAIPLWTHLWRLMCGEINVKMILYLWQCGFFDLEAFASSSI